MRDDLLHAQAAVDWVIAKLIAFTPEVTEWLALNHEVVIEKTEPSATHDNVVLIEKAPLPYTFTVEIGSYLNVIRSSLDILATTLAKRYSVPKPDKAQFPCARDEAAFLDGDYKGVELVEALPVAVQAIIKSLKPYKEGNEYLWTLHHLDIIRKHKRLIDVVADLASLTVTGLAVPDNFIFLGRHTVRVSDKVIFGRVKKGAPTYNFEPYQYIALNEAGSFEKQPVEFVLMGFARRAEAIIKMFDIP